jgi:hypothetical protein
MVLNPKELLGNNLKATAENLILQLYLHIFYDFNYKISAKIGINKRNIKSKIGFRRLPKQLRDSPCLC